MPLNETFNVSTASLIAQIPDYHKDALASMFIITEAICLVNHSN